VPWLVSRTNTSGALRCGWSSLPWSLGDKSLPPYSARPPGRDAHWIIRTWRAPPLAWPCALTARQPHPTTNPIRAEPAPSIELPNQDADYVSHIALDIGGTLIKLVYFSPDPPSNGEAQGRGGGQPSQGMPAGAGALPPVATTPAGSSITRGGGLGVGTMGWGGQLGWWIRLPASMKTAAALKHATCIKASCEQIEPWSLPSTIPWPTGYRACAAPFPVPGLPTPTPPLHTSLRRPPALCQV